MTDLEYRGIGIRFVATVIDVVVLGIIGYLIAIPTGMTTSGGFDLQGGPALLWFLVGFVYYILLEAQFGQTVGKRLTGIKVVTTDGNPIDYRASVIRNVLRVVDGIVFYLVGAVLIYLSDSQQRLGDRVAETVVVPA